MHTIPKEHIAVSEELSELVKDYLNKGGEIEEILAGTSFFNSNSKTSSWKNLPEFGKTN